MDSNAARPHDKILTPIELLTVITTEIKTVQAHPDLDPLQRGRVLAQLAGVAEKILKVCDKKAPWASLGNMMREAKQRERNETNP